MSKYMLNTVGRFIIGNLIFPPIGPITAVVRTEAFVEEIYLTKYLEAELNRTKEQLRLLQKEA